METMNCIKCGTEERLNGLEAWTEVSATDKEVSLSLYLDDLCPNCMQETYLLVRKRICEGIQGEKLVSAYGNPYYECTHWPLIGEPKDFVLHLVEDCFPRRPTDWFALICCNCCKVAEQILSSTFDDAIPIIADITLSPRDL